MKRIQKMKDEVSNSYTPSLRMPLEIGYDGTYEKEVRMKKKEFKV